MSLRLPIVPHAKADLHGRLRRHLDSLAARLMKEDPGLGNTTPFGPLVRAGLQDRPSLIIEDHSWIQLFEMTGDLSYSYRACLLAGADDLVVVGIARCPDFEDYVRDTLGLGGFEVVSPAGAGQARSLSLRCAEDAELLRLAGRTARRHGGLNVLPYMGTGGVWLLAQRIAGESGLPVSVAAPPPRITRRINDKLWFARCVAKALGRRAVPKGFEAYGPAALIGEVSILARHSPSICIKLPSSASSSGNLVLSVDLLRDLERAKQRDRILTPLRMAGWRDAYPLLVTSWESPVLASPSVQMWIPSAGEGEVIVEGIFDQTLMGRSAEFCGAAPTGLQDPLRRRLAAEAAALGYLFQRLGYFGRCSLDSIVVGRSEARAEVHWVECNGRWGGTSIPMTLANRLLGDWAKRAFLVAERQDLMAPAWRFADFCADVGEHLFRPERRAAGIVALSPSRIEAGSGYELLILADDMAGARALARRVAAAFEGRALGRALNH